ncbi:MAG: LamG-like jellyroll fold domain-containing protein [Patescibacteria group bacterium]|jgi:hypothetical protein
MRKRTHIKPLILLVLLIPLILFVLAIRPPKQSKPAFKKSLLGSTYTTSFPSVGMNTTLDVNSQGAQIEISRNDSTLSMRIPLSKAKLKMEQEELVYSVPEQVVEARYQAQENGLKEEIVLRQKPGNNEFSTEITVDNLIIKTTNSGIPVFFDSKTKEYQFHLEKPYAYDAKGEVTYGVSYSLSPKKATNIDAFKPLNVLGTKDSNATKKTLLGELLPTPENTTEYILTTTIDPDWLHDPKRVYPVIIDPTVIHDTTGEFDDGSLNRIKDTGSPNLESYYHELPADIYTVGLWHMNESSGTTVADSSNNGNNATSASSANISTGILNNTRIFDGTSGTILTRTNTPSLQIPGAITIEAWVKLNNTNNQVFISKTSGSGGLYLGLISSKFVFGNYNVDNTPASTTTPSTGIWYHLAGVYDGTTRFIYVNGTLEAQSSTNATNWNNTNALIIGAGNAAYYVNGQIDEVRISNIARSPEEIKADAQRRPYGVYTSDVIDLTQNVVSWNSLSWTEVGVGTGNGEIPVDDTGLVAQWNFNETSGTTAANNAGSCGSACDGTLTNFANTSGQDVAAGSGWTSANKRWGNGALKFDGIDDYVSAGVNNNFQFGTNPFTIEAWINPSEIKDGTIVCKRDTNSGTGYPVVFFKLDATGYMEALIRDSVGDTTTMTDDQFPIKTGSWYHVVFTREDSDTWKFYINGKQGKEFTESKGNLSSSNLPLYIGVHHYATTYNTFFKGTIDSTRIYSRALSTSEILANYNAGNIELQTRVGSDASPDDGSWEEWKPVTSETVITSMDSDSANWSWDSLATYMPKAKSDESVIKAEGTGSMKLGIGAPQSDANTVGLWRLEENNCFSGYCFFDSSGSNNPAAPTGEVAIVDGFWGKARYFDGNNDYLNINDAASLQPVNITIEAWVKPHLVDSANHVIVNKQRGTSGPVGATYVLSLNSNNKFAMSSYYPDSTGWRNAVGTTTPTPYQWYHVAGTYDGTNLRLYVNGKLEATSALPSLSYLGTRPVKVGASEGATIIGFGTFEYFVGAIDEIRISNVARSAEEIMEAYRAGRDHRISRTISSTDLSNRTKLPFWVASDRQGTFMEATIGESAFANYEPDANTVGLWHLEENVGTGAYIKDSAGTNNGTPDGTTLVQGKVGKARGFAGANDINLGDKSLVDSQQNLTLDGWVYTTTTDAAHHRVFSEQNVLYVGQYGTQVSFYMGNGSGWVNSSTTMGNLSANAWHYVAWVKSGTSAYVYIDGQLTGTMAAPAALGTSANVNYFSTYDGTNQPWTGYLDEMRISNVARTPEEIRQAYEVGRRSHPITIDFKAKLDGGNLIANSGDTSFSIDSTAYGAMNKGDNLYRGDKIIVKENVGGTEYLAQGTVTSVTISTGAVTVASWDSGSTFPTGGFTTNATVFKWQREYFDITGIMPEHRNAINRITLRLTDGSQGANIWLDDIKASGGYLTNPNSTINNITSSTGNRYFQYRAILSSSDTTVSPSLTSVTLDYVSNSPPTAPTTPWCEDQTNPTGVSDTTPEFSAVYTDPEGNTSGHYKIEVNTASDFGGTSMWDSGQTAITVTSGNRSADISYAGSALSFNGSTYYWRIKFWDSLGAEGSWSETQQFTMRSNNASDATTPYCEQTTNPPNVTDLNPEFSAVHTDPNSDAATHYEIEVNTASDFSGTSMWDTGQTAIGSSLASGSRLSDKDYAGTALSYNGVTYYWRIRFWDQYGVIGNWSATQNFTMSNLIPPTNCVLIRNPENTQITVRWTDTNSIEENYQIDKATDTVWSATPYYTAAANSTSYLDTTGISSGHTYQYRIRAKRGAAYSDWCYTPTDDLQIGSIKFEGLKMEGIKIH